MMAVNVYHACIVGIFTTRLRHLFVCGPRRAKNNSSRAAFRCAMARESDRAPQIRTTALNKCLTYYSQTVRLWELLVIFCISREIKEEKITEKVITMK